MERSTIFNGKTHCKWQCSLAMLNYQRVHIVYIYIYNYIILYIYTGKMDKTRSDKIEVRFTIYPNEMRSDYTHT